MSGWWWLGAGALLGLAELAVPGAYLVFFAAAAAVTGMVSFMAPGLGLIGEAIVFAGLSIVAVLAGKRMYRARPVASTDPLLNERAARLVGETVVVAEAIGPARGRVRVGDGAWPATGPALPAGAAARVVGYADGRLVVEAI